MSITMMPNQFPKNAVNGEQDIYLKLQELNHTEDWVAIHSVILGSLDCSAEIGEIDFIVLVPHKGIVLIEVKSDHIAGVDEDGWFFGEHKKRKGNPVKQVGKNLYLLLDYIKEHYDTDPPIMSTLLVFPFANFSSESRENLHSPEWNPQQIIDAEALKDPQQLRTAIINSIESKKTSLQKLNETHQQQTCSQSFQRESTPKHSDFNVQEIGKICKILHPSFCLKENHKSILAFSEQETTQLTIEQLSILEGLFENPRVNINGSPGTGKTFLAKELVRTLCAQYPHQKIAFFCYNRLLSYELINSFGLIPPYNLTITTVHDWMCEITESEITSEQAANPDFWEYTLPSKAIAAIHKKLAEQHENPANSWRPFDRIIIDEAQDLLFPLYLLTLDCALSGGWKHGNWALFSDWKGQNIYKQKFYNFNNFKQNYEITFAKYNLYQNCRNTPSIIKAITTQPLNETRYTTVLRSDFRGAKPGLIFVDPPTHNDTIPPKQSSALLSCLKKLSATGFELQDITVLSFRSAANSLVGKFSKNEAMKAYTHELGAYLAPTNCEYNKFNFCSIQKFKGLESPAVIITDIDKLDDIEKAKLLRIGISRARHEVYLLVTDTPENRAYFTPLKNNFTLLNELAIPIPWEK